jgi:hypothetical protein
MKARATRRGHYKSTLPNSWTRCAFFSALPVIAGGDDEAIPRFPRGDIQYSTLLIEDTIPKVAVAFIYTEFRRHESNDLLPQLITDSSSYVFAH